MTPLIKQSEKVKVKDQEIEVLGEVFPDIVRKNDNVRCFTRITILDERSVPVGDTCYIEAQLKEKELQSAVKLIADNIDKYLYE